MLNWWSSLNLDVMATNWLFRPCSTEPTSSITRNLDKIEKVASCNKTKQPTRKNIQRKITCNKLKGNKGYLISG